MPHDPYLSPLGVLQATEVARHFANLPADVRSRISHLLVSPYLRYAVSHPRFLASDPPRLLFWFLMLAAKQMRRTVQTAYPIAHALGRAIRIEPGFAEYHEGTAVVSRDQLRLALCVF